MSGDSGHNPIPEFSFVVHPSDQGERESTYELEASPSERDALAKRFGLIDIERFCVWLSFVRRRGSDSWHLKGRLEGTVTQSCVVTLEPVTNDVEGEFEVVFYKEYQGDVPDISFDDVIEPLVGDALDLGEIAAEEFALALDPYPRAPGAGVQQSSNAEENGPERQNPFAVLAALKEKK